MPTWESEAVENPLWLDTSDPSAPILKKYEPTVGGWVSTTGVDVQARADLADISLINNYSVIPTYTNGVLTKVEEKDGATVKNSSTLTYNPDGTVNTITEFINGKTVVMTLNYVNGEFSSVTKVVV